MRSALLFLFLATGHLRAADEPVRVTVVVVLASTTSKEVNPKLASLAREIKKKDPEFTGFKLEKTLEKSIPVGSSHTFELCEKKKLTVKVERPKDADGMIGLKISPPGVGDVTYGCACSKFFPVVTPCQTAAGEQVIIAVMAKPCTGK